MPGGGGGGVGGGGGPDLGAFLMALGGNPQAAQQRRQWGQQQQDRARQLAAERMAGGALMGTQGYGSPNYNSPAPPGSPGYQPFNPQAGAPPPQPVAPGQASQPKSAGPSPMPQQGPVPGQSLPSFAQGQGPGPGGAQPIPPYKGPMNPPLQPIPNAPNAPADPAMKQNVSAPMGATPMPSSRDQLSRPAQPGGQQPPPQPIIEQAKKVALQGGPAAVQQFMAAQGYPKNGNWCGEFAAAVVKSAGGQPPRNPQVASNWRNYGNPDSGPNVGDVAVRRGPQTGQTGSHVTFVSAVDPKTGTFKGVGGNQGGGRASESTFRSGDYDFRTQGKTMVRAAQGAKTAQNQVAQSPAGQAALAQASQNQLTVPAAVRWIMENNPNAKPEEVFEAIKELLPVMNAQSQEQTRELKNYYEGERLQQGEQRLADQQRALDDRERGQAERDRMGEENLDLRKKAQESLDNYRQQTDAYRKDKEAWERSFKEVQEQAKEGRFERNFAFKMSQAQERLETARKHLEAIKDAQKQTQARDRFNQHQKVVGDILREGNRLHTIIDAPNASDEEKASAQNKLKALQPKLDQATEDLETELNQQDEQGQPTSGGQGGQYPNGPASAADKAAIKKAIDEGRITREQAIEQFKKQGYDPGDF